jgi:hypothetical protein
MYDVKVVIKERKVESCPSFSTQVSSEEFSRNLEMSYW